MAARYSSYHLHSLAPYRISTPSRFVLTRVCSLPSPISARHFFSLAHRVFAPPIAAMFRHSNACQVRSHHFHSFTMLSKRFQSKSSPRPSIRCFGGAFRLYAFQPQLRLLPCHSFADHDFSSPHGSLPCLILCYLCYCFSSPIVSSPIHCHALPTPLF